MNICIANTLHNFELTEVLKITKFEKKNCNNVKQKENKIVNAN